MEWESAGEMKALYEELADARWGYDALHTMAGGYQEDGMSWEEAYREANEWLVWRAYRTARNP